MCVRVYICRARSERYQQKCEIEADGKIIIINKSLIDLPDDGEAAAAFAGFCVIFFLIFLNIFEDVSI